jgi:catechol 2,3-dioxygenase-like lactoylglutathione lyase family enzyme
VTSHACLQEQVPQFRFDHGAVSVPDLEAAIAWYGSMLGFAVARRFALSPARANCAMLVRDDMRIELFQPEVPTLLPDERRDPDSDVKLLGNKHFAFRTESFDELVAWFEAKGADIAKRVSGSFGQAVFIRDVAGNLVEFVSRPS